MKVIRMILVLLLLVVIVFWSFGVPFGSITSVAGLMNDLMMGIAVFIVFVANSIAVIMDLSKNDYGLLPNRITFVSIGMLALFFGGPFIINELIDFNGT